MNEKKQDKQITTYNYSTGQQGIYLPPFCKKKQKKHYEAKFLSREKIKQSFLVPPPPYL